MIFLILPKLFPNGGLVSRPHFRATGFNRSCVRFRDVGDIVVGLLYDPRNYLLSQRCYILRLVYRQLPCNTRAAVEILNIFVLRRTSVNADIESTSTYGIEVQKRRYLLETLKLFSSIAKNSLIGEVSNYRTKVAVQSHSTQLIRLFQWCRC